ncbi:hypothetical protein [Kineococcus arenarius]|uniref:hypothetical protein n=1 Tax=Kineococcus sp. SYSU DK007 TaxID=3383128 RepID=UPI003D7D6D3C
MVVFTERLRFPAWLRAALIALGVLVAAPIALSLLGQDADRDDRIAGGIAMISVPVLCTATAFLHSTVQVTRPDAAPVDSAEHAVSGQGGAVLRISLSGLWRTSVPISQISTATRASLSAVRAGGVGIRFLGGGHWALLMGHGDVVEIHVPDRHRTYSINTHRAEELLHALRDAGVPQR